MDLIIDKSAGLRGTVKIPPNKSHSFRALLMAGLAAGTSKIYAPAISNDWMLGTEALEMFGGSVEPHAHDLWEIVGTGGELTIPDDVINCGNSGIILRFFTGLAACCEGHTVLTGDESLRHIRPMQPLIDAINQLGAWGVCTKCDGHAPVVVRGKLTGGKTKIDGADSQHISALLIAGAISEADVEIVVENPGEKPWIDVTLGWLKRCGVEFTNENYERYIIKGAARWGGFEYTVPLDWSAGLYPIVAALITPDSEVRIPGMDIDDTQGDKAVLEVLRSMGGDIEITDDGVIVARSSELVGREIDCNDFIDQLPLLAVVGLASAGNTKLVNAAICRGKECDRITATAEAISAMGGGVGENPDGLIIHNSHLHGARLSSYHDHRMVMSMSVAALIADGQTVIHDAGCIKKTFAHFPEQMIGMGCEMRKAE